MMQEESNDDTVDWVKKNNAHQQAIFKHSNISKFNETFFCNSGRYHVKHEKSR